MSAGRPGGADCAAISAARPSPTSGVAVNGLASTAYNVAVGGTDFGDTFQHIRTIRIGVPPTPPTFGSALSYIPEIPWNTSCGSQLYATHSKASPRTYGAWSVQQQPHRPSESILSGELGWIGRPELVRPRHACPSPAWSAAAAQGWPKPSWQSGALGNPADTVRDLPDVSMFASFGPWGHAYAICFSDTNNSGTSCNGTPVAGVRAGAARRSVRRSGPASRR